MFNSFATPWTAACQAPLSIGFPRQEYWSRLPFPSPGDLPDPGIKPMSPTLQTDCLPLSHWGSLQGGWKWKSLSYVWLFVTPWTAVRQAPLSMGFSRQKHWSRLPFPSPGDLPDPGTELFYLLCLLHRQDGSLPVEPLGSFFSSKIYKPKQSS